MASTAQAALQAAVEQAMKKAELDLLRPLEKQYYSCALDCVTQKPMLSSEAKDGCVNQCSSPMTTAQTHLQNTMQRLQAKLSRASQDCQDRIMEKYTGASPDQAAAQREFEACVTPAITDAHQQFLNTSMPAVYKQVSELLKK